MNILVSDPLAKEVRFTKETMIVDLADGRSLSVPLAKFPRLLNAKKADLKDYVISGGGVGIHWDSLDEDISVKGLMIGVFSNV